MSLDLTGYAQCLQCRVLFRTGNHSCSEVTLQRAQVVREALAVAKAKVKR